MSKRGMLGAAIAAVFAVAAPAVGADTGRPLAAPRPSGQGAAAQPHSQRAREPERSERPTERRARADSAGSGSAFRPDPNYQNPYQPSYSPGAVNPGEQHPYFRTPEAGFGYPTGSTGYQGKGIYVIPRETEERRAR